VKIIENESGTWWENEGNSVAVFNRCLNDSSNYLRSCDSDNEM
jgi:hypothetical protein